MQKKYFLLTLLLLCACNKSAENTQEHFAPIKAIQTVKVKNQAITEKRRLSGYIKSVTLAELSFQVSGKLINIKVNAGDFVAKGQVLATLDAEPYRHKLIQAQAELTSATAAFNERSENFLRQQQLFQRKLINQNTIDKASADKEQANSLVLLSKAKVKLKQQELNNTKLRAPFDGTITRRDIEQHEEVSRQQIILEIQDKFDLEVVFLLPTSLANTIKKHDQIYITVPSANSPKLNATVSKISTIENMRGAFNVSATLPSNIENILIGMTADVYIDIHQEDQGIILPESAIVIDAKGHERVFIFNPDKQTVNSKKITTTPLNTEYVTVTSGLNVGDIICSIGGEFLYEGQSVTLYRNTY